MTIDLIARNVGRRWEYLIDTKEMKGEFCFVLGKGLYGPFRSLEELQAFVANETCDFCEARG